MKEKLNESETCYCGCTRCRFASAQWSAHCNTCSFYGSMKPVEPVADVGGGLPALDKSVIDEMREAHKYCNGGLEGCHIALAARERQLLAALREVAELRELLIEVMTNIGALSLTRNPRGQELRKRVTAALAPTPPEER